MAMNNPVGRANYEPNSWGAEGGPREHPARGFVSYPAQVEGSKMRVRSETFADHYSQARQFYISQLPVEQKHIRDALVFELSKVQREDIRSRMVSHLMNIDSLMAEMVATSLGLQDMPEAAKPAMEPRSDLPPSPKLSILANGPGSFKGRKRGVLMTDGADVALFKALKDAVEASGAMVEIIAPRIGGIVDNTGNTIPAQQKLGGGPSVLYDAVALLLSDDGAAMIASEATARDFVNDAFAHCKFIAYSSAAMSLLQSAGIAALLDDGCFELDQADSIAAFMQACAGLRFWQREESVHKG